MLIHEHSRPGRRAFAQAPKQMADLSAIPAEMRRAEPPALPEVSEMQAVRHYTRLSQQNFSIDTQFYPLGSCTMKYNPKINERQAALPGFAGSHPLLPESLSQGALKLIYDLEHYLAEVTGLPAISLQPAAGSHGELTGMLIFAAYHKNKGKPRTKVLIPDTAHGTNPASAALCGFKSVPLKSGKKGILEPAAVAELMDEETAGIMVTNPNTLGLFEREIGVQSTVLHRNLVRVLDHGELEQTCYIANAYSALSCTFDVPLVAQVANHLVHHAKSDRIVLVHLRPAQDSVVHKLLV